MLEEKEIIPGWIKIIYNGSHIGDFLIEDDGLYYFHSTEEDWKLRVPKDVQAFIFQRLHHINKKNGYV